MTERNSGTRIDSICLGKTFNIDVKVLQLKELAQMLHN